MPNKNYLAGRRLEYEVMKDWEKCGYEVFRTAGSHGRFDVIAIRSEFKAQFIQCKRVATEAQMRRLIKKFRKDTVPSFYYHQSLAIKVKGQSAIEWLHV